MFGVRAGYTLPFNVDLRLLVRRGGRRRPARAARCSRSTRSTPTSSCRSPSATSSAVSGASSCAASRRARSARAARCSSAAAPFGIGELFFTPVGRSTAFAVEDDDTLAFDAFCDDQPDVFGNQGDGNGKCNSLYDNEIDDFDDLDETDVIGGNKFISATLRVPLPDLRRTLGLAGIVFLDMGNAFDETQRHLFDVGEWRYGTGVGVLVVLALRPAPGVRRLPARQALGRGQHDLRVLGRRLGLLSPRLPAPVPRRRATRQGEDGR